MSFAIEAPGEAQPLSPDELYVALQDATSSATPAPRRQATIFLNRTLPYEIRLLSIIQLKNGVDKYWRTFSHIKGGIQDEEKTFIRSRLFQGTVEEENGALALHNALAAAKIIRIDYPQHWPDAMSNLIGLLRTYRNGNPAHLQGALLLVLRVVKELATARLRKSQTALQGITPELAYLLVEMYSERTAIWLGFLAGGQGEKDAADHAILHSLLCARILRLLIITGYDNPYKDKTVESFWSISQGHFGQFLGYISQGSAVPGGYRNVIGKHLVQFSKLHIALSDSHPASFVSLPNSLPLLHAYWDLVAKFAAVFDKSDGARKLAGAGNESKYEDENALHEKLALMALTLLRNCVRIAHRPFQSFRYRTDDEKREREEAVQRLKTEWLTDEFVTQMTNVLITQLFLFRKSDLEAWVEEPEEWEHREQGEGNAYEFEVRPCAEKLFLDLLTSYKSMLIPPLLTYFQTSTAPGASVATKEAVYTAMGLAAAHIVTAKQTSDAQANQLLDFDGLLTTTLTQDAQEQGPLAKVLRRRLAILLSSWIIVQSTETNRPVVYQLFTHFMNPNDEANDLVVRITAARQLRWVVDEMLFDVDQFLPYAGDVMPQLVELISNVEIDDTKLAILETIRILVTRMESRAAQFGDFIMAALPHIWESSGDEDYMVKQAVIAIFSALVMSMGPESQKYQHHILPMLAEVARPGSDLHMALVDEGLELWNSIIMQSNPPLSPDLTNLIEYALPLLEYQGETARSSLEIIESYIIMAPQAVLEDRLRRPILAALGPVLESQSRERVRTGTACIENIIRAATELGGAGGVSVVLQDMMETGFLQSILQSLREAWEAHQTTGPNRKVSKLNTVTEGDYFAIIARLALAEPNAFMMMLGSFGPVEAVWDWLGSEWFSHLGSMDDLPRQKLYLLALTRILELPDPVQTISLGKLQDYFTMWNSTISELQDGVSVETDCLMEPELPVEEWHCPKNVKENELAAKDPVHSVHAFDFVKARLGDVVQRVGGEERFEAEWGANVDREVLEAFRRLSQAVGQRGA
ncbi:related to nuclear transport factor [Cephalotrichum gorgonifer]|uniref:Related to nuclear transport factor n=1 Tax=Cephalotrichum gorgonifer TaxID=2041049 RepID=A0AAE8MYR2_9PEZI|nr:related to nuclear transport factor [Cephalotrichum gorgonifer]